MKRLSEKVKVDIGVVPQTLNNSNVTGGYFSMTMCRSILAVLICGAMASTKTTKIELLQAQDKAGTNSKGIPNTAEQEASATVTANTFVAEATVALVAAAATDKVTINGIVFTMAAATDATKREFANAAGLVTCVNNATYGVAGVVATAVNTTVTLKAIEPGNNVITVEGTDVAGTVTVATTKALAFVELDAAQLDTENGFTYVAPKVTTTANTVTGIVLLRGDGRFSPEQVVGASRVL